MLTLLALDKKEFLIKTPLTEHYLNDNDSTYSCSMGVKSLVIGYDNPETGFQNLATNQLTIAERYCASNWQFDFSIFKEDDFRDENETISLVAPRINAFPPLVLIPVSNGVYVINVGGSAIFTRLQYSFSGVGGWIDIDYALNYLSGVSDGVNQFPLNVECYFRIRTLLPVDNIKYSNVLQYHYQEPQNK
jgi:hypothetical protein